MPRAARQRTPSEKGAALNEARTRRSTAAARSTRNKASSRSNTGAREPIPPPSLAPSRVERQRNRGRPRRVQFVDTTTPTSRGIRNASPASPSRLPGPSEPSSTPGGPPSSPPLSLRFDDLRSLPRSLELSSPLELEPIQDYLIDLRVQIRVNQATKPPPRLPNQRSRDTLDFALINTSIFLSITDINPIDLLPENVSIRCIICDRCARIAPLEEHDIEALDFES
jgi:hypothetical protein